MELANPKTRKYTVEEYFRLAEASPTKLEYMAGEIFDMAGESYDHNQIAANILGELRNRLKGGPCKATGSDTRVQGADGRYCYPDVTVICGEPIFDPRDSGTTVTNPKVIFEVLSASTEATDRGEKFLQYIHLDSMREYFLVNQHRPQVESFARRTDGSWSVGDLAAGINVSLKIHSLNVEVPLREIYADIHFGN